MNSVPKSGTYLVGKILDEMEVPATGYHLRKDRYWNWNLAADLDEIIRAPKDFLSSAGLSDTLALIGPGYTYAHLDHTPEILDALHGRPGLQHIFLYRDLRNCMVSQMRFMEARNRKNGKAPDERPDRQRFADYMRRSAKGWLHNAHLQLGWLDEDSVVPVRFEDLERQMPQPLVRMLRECGYAGDPDLAHARAHGARTRTYSGRVSAWADYWSDEAAAVFAKLGGPALNARLGYVD